MQQYCFVPLSRRLLKWQPWQAFLCKGAGLQLISVVNMFGDVVSSRSQILLRYARQQSGARLAPIYRSLPLRLQWTGTLRVPGRTCVKVLQFKASGYPAVHVFAVSAAAGRPSCTSVLVSAVAAACETAVIAAVCESLRLSLCAGICLIAGAAHKHSLPLQYRVWRQCCSCSPLCAGVCC